MCHYVSARSLDCIGLCASVSSQSNTIISINLLLLYLCFYASALIYTFSSTHLNTFLLLSVNIASESHDERGYYFKHTDEETCQKIAWETRMGTRSSDSLSCTLTRNQSFWTVLGHRYWDSI